MRRPLYAELSCGGRTLRLGGRDASSGLMVTSDGIEGWWSTPDPKWSLTERQGADGAHAVSEDFVLYSARTVTLHLAAVGADRAATLALVTSLLGMAHRLVRLRVVDAGEDTYAEGLLSVESDAGRSERVALMTATLVCPDPRRLATEPSDAWLLPAQAHGGGVGLSYGASGAGLRYPLDYGAGATDSRSSATVRNAGSAPAHPVVTLTGPLDAGATVTVSAGGSTASVTIGRAVAGGTSVTVDFRTRTASQGRLDVTRQVTATGWAPVPAGGEAACTLQATGTGSALVRVRDTYI